MCGITGFVVPGGTLSREEMMSRAVAMSDTIESRGPDSDGHWVDRDGGAAFGHRRLAIIDLSPAGHQPMVSSCGRYVICYNGEVYNFPELRRELEQRGRQFAGHSDTEVIVEGCAEWGVEATVRRLIGMFAIALWDRAERTLYLVRDRLGIKPLYYGLHGDRLLFGSELKCLRAYPGWRPEIRPEAVVSYLRFCYVPAPGSIFNGVHKLMPGEILTYRQGEAPRLARYWDLADVARAGLASRFAGSDEAAVDELEALLMDAVARRMVADVPLGAFLSGGIDSSVVVALMQAQSERPVRSFSIGFHEAGYDEARHAKAVASHLGTEHTELYVDPARAIDVIPRIPDYYDEPFADSSQIPTFLVSEMTRRHVTVSLSGDGGDELFCGYNRYFLAQRLRRRFDLLPMRLRVLGARAIALLSPGAWDALFRVVPRRFRPPQPGDKVHKLASILPEDEDAMYRRLVSQWPDPEQLVPGVKEPLGLMWDRSVRDIVPDYTERLQYLDTLTYLPDDILTKVDRASMAVSLEARVPLLDHRVVEFAWRLPMAMKLRGAQSKWLLRQVLYRHVPRELIERPKMGFGIPIDVWLRGPLREWAEDLLSARAMREAGLIEPGPVQSMWRQHQSGTVNWAYPLWNVLMFQAWQRRWS